MIRIRWSQPARDDLAQIDEYHRNLDPEYAQRAIASAVAAGHFLCEHPLAGQAVNQRRQRKWRVRGTPYILLYKLQQNSVHIDRVIHAAQDWARFT